MKSNKKAKNNSEQSRSLVVKIAGFMFLFAFIVPTLNWAFILSGFNVAGDPNATADTIVANEFLFRLGITIELFLSVSLVLLGLALYIILKPVNKNIAMLALFLKLIEAALMAVTVLIPYIALQFIDGDAALTAFTKEQLQIPIGIISSSHTGIASIAMVFLGLDMMLFSYLFFKSKYIPRILAGFGILSFALILIQSIMFILAPAYAASPINQIIFWTPSGLFEIIIGVWLLSKGIHVEQADQ